MTFGTTPVFLEYFGLRSLEDLPAADELRRIVVVKLTRRGRRKVEARKAIWQRRWQDALEGLDDDELRTAARVLERIGGVFCEESKG